MKQSVLYARYSPRPGMTSDSCESQSAKCRTWSESNGYEVIGYWYDEALSGKTTEGREGLEQALKQACAHKATLCVYSLSRLARSTKDAIAILDRLKESGAHLAILDMQIDTSTAIGVFFFTVMSAWAQLEREQISQRTSDSMRFKSSQGKRVGRYARYGWNVDGTENEHEQSMASRVRAMSRNDYDPREICNILNYDLALYRGRRWKTRDVKKILGQY